MGQNLTFNRQNSLQINSSVLTVNRLEGWKKFYKIPHPLKPWRKIQTTDTWSWPWGNDQILKKNITIKERKKLVVYHSLTKLRTPKAWILIMKKKVVKFLSGVGQNIKTFPRTWEKPADYLKHLQVLKKTIFHLSRAWDEYQALFIEIRGTFSYVIKSFFSMIVGHPCYDIVPVASNLIQARFRTHKIQEKKWKVLSNSQKRVFKFSSPWPTETKIYLCARKF